MCWRTVSRLLHLAVGRGTIQGKSSTQGTPMCFIFYYFVSFSTSSLLIRHILDSPHRGEEEVSRVLSRTDVWRFLEI